jgi:hypothetical protein
MLIGIDTGFDFHQSGITAPGVKNLATSAEWLGRPRSPKCADLANSKGKRNTLDA